MAEVLILGAGVVGMTTAYALARSGHRVTVIDAASSPAEGGASFGNGAQLSYSYTDALASPSMVRTLPKYLLGMDPAFRMRPTISPAFWRWSLDFLSNASRSKFETNTIEVMKLAMESRQGIAELKDRISFDHRSAGKLNLYATAEAIRQAETLSRLKNEHGAQQVILSRAEAIEKEPALEAYGHRFEGALWSPLDESGDSRAFCLGLHEILKNEYGVQFLLGVRVTSIETRSGTLSAIRTIEKRIECENAVISLGVHSADIAATAGIRLPIWPMQGYSMTIPATSMAPTASITDTARKVVFCRIGDRLRIAGLADIGAKNGKFDRTRYEVLARTAEAIFPQAGDYSHDLEAWTGMRPMTPNSQPLTGATMVKGVFVNCGHGSLGWTLSMGSAERLAKIVG